MADDAYENIKIEKEDGITWLILDRPAIFTVKSATGAGAMDRGYHRAGDALEHRAENGVAAGKCTAGPRDRLLFGPLSPGNRG